jgi:phytoene synthase
LRGGSRSFHAASRLLPAEVRNPATVLYAFCRLADDAVDLSDNDPQATDRLRDRLDRLYRGEPLPIPADRALAEVVVEHGIPRELLDALIEGFEWDAEGRRYEDLAELRAYAARVAGAVGVLMTMIMGVRAPETVARAAEMGLAMQLSNIARDVGEDARNGRIYLPLSWLREAGIDPEAWLAEPVFAPALGSVIARLLAAADSLYQGAAHAIADLPRPCQPGIRAAQNLYAAIGHEVARRGYDSVAARAVVPLSTKLRLVARSLMGGEPAARPSAAPAPEIEFLVKAVEQAPPPRPVAERRQPSWWRVDEQALTIIDLFERMEQREQA